MQNISKINVIGNNENVRKIEELEVNISKPQSILIKNT